MANSLEIAKVERTVHLLAVERDLQLAQETAWAMDVVLELMKAFLTAWKLAALLVCQSESVMEAELALLAAMWAYVTVHLLCWLSCFAES